MGDADGILMVDYLRKKKKKKKKNIIVSQADNSVKH